MSGFGFFPFSIFTQHAGIVLRKKLVQYLKLFDIFWSFGFNRTPILYNIPKLDPNPLYKVIHWEDQQDMVIASNCITENKIIQIQ